LFFISRGTSHLALPPGCTSWPSDSSSHSSEIPRILWNQKVHHRVHNSPSLFRYPTTYQSAHAITSHFLKKHFNITLPSTPRSPSLLYNAYRVSFPGVKRPGRGVDHPLPSIARVKERVELYLNSPSGPSWPVLGLRLGQVCPPKRVCVSLFPCTCPTTLISCSSLRTFLQSPVTSS
jgi:hypothetical protein